MPPNNSNPRKRRREIPNVDVKLVEIYEDLANEKNEIRLKAAGELLSRFTPDKNPTEEDVEKAIHRLFRGLCSSRKAARVGFSIALTELLATVFASPDGKRPANLDVPKIIEILEKMSTLTGAASGQEERDHYFGRLFGAEAILKSSILLQPDVQFENWTKLLTLIFELAKLKPWLKEECGYILFTTVAFVASKKVDAKYIEGILSGLVEHNLVKTPEGVAIWLAALEVPTKLEFPEGVWQHGSPIHIKEKATLSKIMKGSSDPKAEAESQKSGVWNPKLHFAWEIILPKMYAQDAFTFSDIWTEVVDNGLFANSSSQERKFWGFQVFSKVLNEAPEGSASCVFTKNAIRSLINQLSVQDRYLHRSAVKASKAIQARVAKEPAFLPPAIRGLMGPNGAVNFDQLTKTKTIEKMLGDAAPDALLQIIPFIADMIMKPGTEDIKVAASVRQQLSGQLHLIVKSQSNPTKPASDDAEKVTEKAMQVLARFAYFVPDDSKAGVSKHTLPPITQTTQELFRNRIGSCLNALLSSRKAPASVAYKVVRKIRDLSESAEYGKFVIEMNDVITESLENAFKALKKINKKEKDQSEDSSLQAFKLLYSMTILQVYNGDADAVSMLDELQLCSNNLLGSKEPKPGQEPESADLLVEILLSFASKQSQLFRRTSEQVFGAFAEHITESGLRSMLAVLEAKDSMEGQQELFDNADHDDDDDDDVEMEDASDLDSDVEVVEASDNESDNDEPEADGEDDEDDDELQEFDAKLAAALGTHRADPDDSASSSDADMNDDEMEALDEQLVKVFKARAQTTNKKKERKDAKETMINFKSRVLDLLEIYVKKAGTTQPAGITILVPLLNLIRRTKTSQLANKAATVIREYARACKGSSVPSISAEQAQSIKPILAEIHEEARRSGPNSHGAACSQASLLVVKVLVAQDKEAIREIVDVYAETRKEQLLSRKCHVQPAFFSDWHNWCVSASKMLKKE